MYSAATGIVKVNLRLRLRKSECCGWGEDWKIECCGAAVGAVRCPRLEVRGGSKE